MATIEASPIRLVEAKTLDRRRLKGPALTLAALTVAAIVIQGYHPYAEDGGIYLPGIEKLLHPELFPSWSQFVTVQSRFSLFPSLVATLVKRSGLDLMAILLLLHVLSISLLIIGAWKIAVLCFRRSEVQLAAVTLLAFSLSMPIAGTSLMLMDPYVTARSFSTPLGLLAIAGALGIITSIRRYARIRQSDIALIAGGLMLALIVHPLMAAYTIVCVALLLCTSLPVAKWRYAATFALCLTGFVFAAGIEILITPRGSIYTQVAKSRTYWFLGAWQWYEQFGLIAPLIVIALLCLRGRARSNVALTCLAQMAIAAGVTGASIAIVLARESSSSLSIAMLQPLRVFLIVYTVMILVVGAAVGEWFLHKNPWRWAVVFSLLGTLMAFVQLRVFPYSDHLELAWNAPTNEWERGFLWIRSHTPTDAVFALDADYITTIGEDTQNFRAVAQRSALPDYSKDGGVAAIAPDLAQNWIYGQQMQSDLATESDAQRYARLHSASVEWLILPTVARTKFPCVYANDSMKVCRVAKS